MMFDQKAPERTRKLVSSYLMDDITNIVDDYASFYSMDKKFEQKIKKRQLQSKRKQFEKQETRRLCRNATFVVLCVSALLALYFGIGFGVFVENYKNCNQEYDTYKATIEMNGFVNFANSEIVNVSAKNGWTLQYLRQDPMALLDNCTLNDQQSSHILQGAGIGVVFPIYYSRLLDTIGKCQLTQQTTKSNECDDIGITLFFSFMSFLYIGVPCFLCLLFMHDDCDCCDFCTRRSFTTWDLYNKQ